MSKIKNAYLTIAVFIALVTVFYLLGYWMIFRMGQATPLMLSVGAATLVTCLVRKKHINELGWTWGSWKIQQQSYLIPFFIVLAAYILIWLIGGGELYNSEFLADKKQSYNLSEWTDLKIFIFHFLLTSTVVFLMSVPSILGEEIGWRGLLVPELSKVTSFTGVALISGSVWALFHWPLILLGLYGNDGTSIYYQLFFFTLFIISSSTIMAYIRLKTGSVWTAVMYHGASNVFIQKVFTPITITNDNSHYYIDEFGAILALVVTAVAIVYWKKGVREYSSLTR
ncbi:MAG: CPBP family intramembrane metalloprotease [Alteromonadaceae bacterium]|nr:CPBP family intramembrane metalloprotease [Alteromonadaceae bacterium]